MLCLEPSVLVLEGFTGVNRLMSRRTALYRTAFCRATRSLAVLTCLLTAAVNLTNCTSSSTVSNGTLTSIDITPARPTVGVGASTQLLATGTYSDGTKSNVTASVSWTSSDTTLATIESNGQQNPGLATGVAKGAPTITASLNGVSDTATLNVVQNPTLTSISITPASTTVSIGATTQFIATGNFSDGSARDITTGASWTSSDTTKATVETAGGSKPGLATGVAAGSVTITASLNGISGTAALKIVPPSTLTEITVEPTSPTILIGAQQQFSATGTFSDGTLQDVTNTVTWTSSNTGEATIETQGQQNPGLASGQSAGIVTIAATSGSISGQTSLTVETNNPNIIEVIVDPDSPTIAAGATQQFYATAKLADGSNLDITNTAVWTSSNTSAATIETSTGNQPGLVNGVAAGSTTISASDSASGVTGSTTITLTTSQGNGRKDPISDMTGTANYLSFQGGLYGKNSNTVPAAHDADGKAIAKTIQPLDTNGNPSTAGTILFASIGMSNAADEFGAFIRDADGNPQVNQDTLTIVNGAKGGITACDWVAPTGAPACDLSGGNQYDRVRDDVLAPLGLTEQQVQIVWIKEANGGPGVGGCGSGPGDTGEPCRALCDPTVKGTTCSNDQYGTEALRYEAQLGDILRAAKTRWPNLKLAFISSRIYGGYASIDLSPEPYAYEYGFSTQFLMTAQITQCPTSACSGSVDPIAGDLGYNTSGTGTVPWVAWSAYLWANGPNPRSDGLFWCNGQTAAPCSGEVDFQSDGTHPNAQGQQKVATMLTNFFLTSPYTKGWFAATAATAH